MPEFGEDLSVTVILIVCSPAGKDLYLPSISSANEVVPITPIVDIEIKQDIINDLKFLDIKLPLILYISI